MLFPVVLFLVASFHFKDVKATNSTGIEESGRNLKAEDKCKNFCMNNGICSVDKVEGRPYCECLKRYSGETCEIDKCTDVCKNGGTCSWDDTSDRPVCACPKEYTGERCEINPDCDCGPQGDCSHVNGHKVCKCNPGYAEVDGTCEVCNCGSDGTCHFEEGMKTCICDEGFYELHGVCKDFPPLSVEMTFHETTVTILFWPAIPPGMKLLSVDVQIKTKDDQHLLYEVKPNQYGRFELEYKLADGLPKERRHRSETNMGISRWSNWYIMPTPWGQNDPPIILTPVNGSVVHPGSVLVKWEAPHPDLWVDWFEVHLTTVPEELKYNVTNLWRNDDQRHYESSVNAERENQDYKVLVRCVSHNNASSEATVFFRTLSYHDNRLGESGLTSTQVGLIVAGVILAVVFIGVGIFYVKRSPRGHTRSFPM